MGRFHAMTRKAAAGTPCKVTTTIVINQMLIVRRFFAEKKNDEGRPVRSSHRILPKTVKEEFLRKELTCYEFSDITQEQEEDLFQRVQKGVQLTPAEKLRATRGPWQSFAIMYEHDFEAVATSEYLPGAYAQQLPLTVF